MNGRRLLLFAAVLLLLAGLAAGLAPRADERSSAPDPRPVAREVEVIERRLSTDKTDQSIVARVGDLIRLEVVGDTLDQVEIERLERYDAIEPLTPARIEVIPDAPGVYPIRLVEADRRIGRLDIKP